MPLGSRARACACACAALLSLPGAAAAEVLSVSGDFQRGPPPSPDLRPGHNESPFGWAWLELAGFSLEVTMPGLDRIFGEVPPGRWGGGASPPTDPGVPVAGGDTFSSHLIHVDALDGEPGRYAGDVTFDGEIVAVFVSGDVLYYTDYTPGFEYAEQEIRGVELFDGDPDGDVVERGPDGLTLRLDLRVDGFDRVDELRVITRATRPRALVVLECPVEVRVEGETVTMTATLRNEAPEGGTEPSLPVELLLDWSPDLAGGPGGRVTFDGVTLTCVGTPGVMHRCPLGRVPAGAHAIEGVATLPPGTSTTLTAELRGADTAPGSCAVAIEIPGTEVDGGVPPPGPRVLVPGFGGGGGARCAATPAGGSPRAALMLLAALCLARCCKRR